MCFCCHFVAPHRPRSIIPILVILVKSYFKWWAMQPASHLREHQLNYLVLLQIDGELRRQGTLHSFQNNISHICNCAYKTLLRIRSHTLAILKHCFMYSLEITWAVLSNPLNPLGILRSQRYSEYTPDVL